MDKRFDVIIIGSGAGGGTLAKQLAPSGKTSCFSSVATGSARGEELGYGSGLRAEPLYLAGYMV